MKKVSLLFLVCALLITVCACQPTPKESVVISKNDGKLEGAIFGDESPAVEYDFPTEWKEDGIQAASGNVTINVDAQVLTPDVDKYPVYYVSLDEEFSQEYADKLLNYFIGDAELVSEEQLPMTKNEIMDLISQYDDEIKNADPSTYSIGDVQNGTQDVYEYKLQWLEDEIARLQEEFKTAPEEAVPGPVERTFRRTENEDGDFIGYRIEGRTSDNTRVSLYKDSAGRMNMKRTVSFNFPTKGGFGKRYLTTDISSYGMTNYTYESAKELADKTLADLGKEGYDVAFSGSCSLYYPQEPGADFVSEDELPRGYLFYYSKVVDDIPVLLEFNSYGNIEAYTEQWPRNFIRIVVSNEGVSNYYEFSTLKIGDKLNDNIELLPFDKIQEIFRKYIAMKVSVFDEGYDEGYDTQASDHIVTINDVRLGYVRIAEKDRNDRGYLMPVWMFYGDETYKYESQYDTEWVIDENNERHIFDMGHSYLCINAVDGSIIDLAAGY